MFQLMTVICTGTAGNALKIKHCTAFKNGCQDTLDDSRRDKNPTQSK